MLPNSNIRQKIGHYKIFNHKLLGKGSHSLVYQGLNTITGEKVSIKRVEITSQLLQKQAENELNCLKSLKDPNVLRYIHHFHQGRYLYIVTQMCDYNLHFKMIKDGKMSAKVALELFLEILKGYLAIRKNGYLHRDLKPENIFLKEGKVKIGDFGYCVKWNENEMKQDHNIGTPLYMAPQTIQKNIYSEKTQIWSLGLILYELLHGQTPFKSKWEGDLRRQIRQPITNFHCDPIIQKLIGKCLTVQPKKRYCLEKLQQQIKIVLNKLSQIQQETRKKIKQCQQIKIIENQLNYLSFLQYLQRLCHKCNRQVKKQEILYILQFNIRIRINFIELFLQQNELNNQKYGRKFQETKQNHNFCLQQPKNMEEQSRIQFFRATEMNYNQMIVWQTQAMLKQIILSVYSNIKSIKSEEQAVRFQNQLRLVDFLMTAFVLNRIIIENDSNQDKFAKYSELETILNRPSRINWAVFRMIVDKLKELKII